MASMERRSKTIVLRYGGEIIGTFADKGKRGRGGELEVSNIVAVLADGGRQTEQVLFDTMRRLRSMELQMETIKAARVERAVKGLKHHPGKRVRYIARLLLYCWKLSREESRHAAPTQCQEEVVIKPPVLAPVATTTQSLRGLPQQYPKSASANLAQKKLIVSEPTHIPQAAPPVPTPHSRPQHPLSASSLAQKKPPFIPPHAAPLPTPQSAPPPAPKKLDDRQLQGKIAAAKRKLQESYAMDRDGKKQRCVKIIEPPSLPKQVCCPKKRPTPLQRKCFPNRCSTLPPRRPVLY